MTLLYHILISSGGLAIAFLLYYFLFRNTNDFKQVRLFLIASVLLALLLPLHDFKMNWMEFFSVQKQPVKILWQPYAYTSTPEVSMNSENEILWADYFLTVYYMVTTVLLLRLILQTFVLLSVYTISEKRKRKEYILVINNRFQSHFTFFRWVFVHEDHIEDENITTILAHERIHAQQLHSLDLMFTEIAAALMWFNPLVWRLRNTVQLIHEYLADEGALSTGIDRFAYQALLINQVAEERFIRLSSNFNHSLIKKRMIMMTKSKNSRNAKLRNLVLLPLAILLFVAVAGLNSALGQEEKKEKEEKETKIIKKKVKVIHLDDDEDENVFIVKKGGKNSKTIELLVDGDDTLRVKKSYSYSITTNGDDTENEFVWIKDSSKGKHIKIEVSDTDHDIHIDTDKSFIEISDEDLENTLLIIDGKEQKDTSKINKLDPEEIETMEVLKGKEVVKKHTKKDVEKVIIIKTKKGKK